MKIDSVELDENQMNTYIVCFVPNFIEWLFGYNIKRVKYRWKGQEFKFGGGGVYYRKDGSRLGNGHRVAKAIDMYRNKW